MNNEIEENKFMFTEPKHGWSDFNIYKYYKLNYLPFNDNILSKFRVSYIDNVPIMMFKTLIKAFDKKEDCFIEFDAEGYEWSLLISYYNGIKVIIPEYIFNPFKSDENDFSILLHSNILEFCKDWLGCYQNYRSQWNIFYGSKCIENEANLWDVAQYTELDKYYDEFMNLIKEKTNGNK